METTTMNGVSSALDHYETPFADASMVQREHTEDHEDFRDNYKRDQESPFLQTYLPMEANSSSPEAPEFVQLLSELNDDEFAENFYQLASELEDTWNSRITNEVAMGNSFGAFAAQQASEYFNPLIKASSHAIDAASDYFSRRKDQLSESEIDEFFETIETTGLSPAQDQFLGSVLKKVKSVVKKGVQAVGKILPVNIILNRIKGLVRPLLDRVLKFAVGKLPKNLQPYATTLASKFLKLETSSSDYDNENPFGMETEVDAVQTELDNSIANLVFASNEIDVDNLVMDYESNQESNRDASVQDVPPIHVARERFVNELRSLQPGESPAPVIERFLPAAIIALRPLIKSGIAVVGRQRVINFLAGILAKLIARYVPENVSKPLAASIIDTGMKAIGFETYESDRSDVAYEALANTIEETVQNMGELSEEAFDDNETLTMNLMEAFEAAAANNFPPQYLREDLRVGKKGGVWVMKPRKGPRHLYKKYSRVFNVTIDPAATKSILIYRNLPLLNFLRDKLGLDINKPVQAKVHLYEAIVGTKLSQIGKHESLPGLSASHPHSWIQLLPLTTQAASMLLNDPALGKDVAKEVGAKRTRITAGQRFYYLEIDGAKLRLNFAKAGKPVRSGDVRGVINFVKSEISLNYYFSEEESKSIASKLNQNDFLGTAALLKNSVRGILKDILIKNITSKVKIVHEAFPEMFIERYRDQQEIGNVLGSAKTILTSLITKLIDKIAGRVFDQIKDYFKARAEEFKRAQAEPEDGVTISVKWRNVAGLSALKTAISAIRGNLSLGSLTQLSAPNLPAPEIHVKAGKHFE
jgi:hypothetical protein